MLNEIAYTIDRGYRVIEDNFWYTVQRRGPIRWQRYHATRDRSAAIALLEQQVRRRQNAIDLNEQRITLES